MTEMLNVTRRLLPVILIVIACLSWSSRAQADQPPQYPDSINELQIPDRPAHRTWFVDEPLPENGESAYADQMNNILGQCIRSANEGGEGRWASFRQSQFFGLYAVWGLCSPDSQHADSEVLVESLRTWMDENYPEEAGGLQSGWKAWYLYAPLVEISARARLQELVGKSRLERGVRRALEEARKIAEDGWENILKRSVEIVNFPAHGQMAMFTLGWVLAREHEPELAPRLLRRAGHILRMLQWHMQPNGTIRYIYEPDFESPQLVAEQMYYHNINMRAIYMYWWFVGEDLADQLLQQQTPYYKLRIMPWAGRGGAPHGTHYHSAIWWKEQWRTFWPGAVALSAAATGDGELAELALTMAQRGTGGDRKFADWAVHGYKQLALRNVEPTDRADGYVVTDPDIGGLRLRFGEFSSAFTSNSYGYTLAGALTPSSGLAGAYPLVRIDALAHNPKYQFNNLHIAGLQKPHAMLDVQDDAAAAAGSYVPHDQRTTWRDPHVSGPWRIRQAWLYLPDRIVGLMVLQATGSAQARSAEHIFRLMTSEVTPTEDASYDAGDLHLTVGPTNLAHRLVEPARKFAMSKNEPWRQVVLSDRPRPSKPDAREQADGET
ncbi:MAG: hypothetical protein ACODAQ_04545, partial [Phycisphaeraceae bacterium]